MRKLFRTQGLDRRLLEVTSLEDRSQPALLNQTAQLPAVLPLIPNPLGLPSIVAPEPAVATETTTTTTVTTPQAQITTTQELINVSLPGTVLQINVTTETITPTATTSGAGSTGTGGSTGSTGPVIAGGSSSGSTTSGGTSTLGSASTRGITGNTSTTETSAPASLALLPPGATNVNPNAPQTASGVAAVTTGPNVAFGPPDAGGLANAGSLYVPVGGVDGAIVAVAPAPRPVEMETLPPTAVPMTPSVEPPAATTETAPVQQMTLAPVGEAPATVPLTSIAAPPTEETGFFDNVWGWIGGVTAALAAGGYLMLRRGQLGRFLSRWAARKLPAGTILSTDLDRL